AAAQVLAVEEGAEGAEGGPAFPLVDPLPPPGHRRPAVAADQGGEGGDAQVAGAHGLGGVVPGSVFGGQDRLVPAQESPRRIVHAVREQVGQGGPAIADLASAAVGVHADVGDAGQGGDGGIHVLVVAAP